MKFLFQSVARFNWVVFFYYWVVELLRVFPGGSVVKNLPAKQETQVWSLVQKDPLEKEMPTHSSVLAWKISWTEEPWRAVNWGTKSQTRLSNKFFFFKLYNIVLVLPNIEMNPPQVYMCFPSWTLLPPPSSLPKSSLWVVPVHQPQASSIVHRSFFTCSEYKATVGYFVNIFLQPVTFLFIFLKLCLSKQRNFSSW